VLCRFRLDDLNAPPWHIDAVTGASTKSLPGYRLLAISEVARPAGIHTSQLFRWRQQLCERVQVPVAFNPVAITPEPEAASVAPVAEKAGVIEIEFATGGRMRITGAVDAPTVTALMKALAKGKRRR
jgi:transposase